MYIVQALKLPCFSKPCGALGQLLAAASPPSAALHQSYNVVHSIY